MKSGGYDSERPDEGQIIMNSAAEALEKGKGKVRLTTGNGDLDALIGSVEEGLAYLFYGDREILEALVHGLLVNCVLPHEKGGFGAKGTIRLPKNARECKRTLKRWRAYAEALGKKFWDLAGERTGDPKTQDRVVADLWRRYRRWSGERR